MRQLLMLCRDGGWLGRRTAETDCGVELLEKEPFAVGYLL